MSLSSSARLRSILERSGGELGGDTVGGKRLFPVDAGGFGRFRGGDLFLVDRAVAGNLAPADFFLQGDALVGDDALLRDARALGRLAGGDLGLLQIARAFDFEAPVLLLLGDARHVNRQLLSDARLLGFFACRDLGLFDVARRSISRRWSSSSRAIRASVRMRSWAMRARSTRSWAAISASSIRRPR